MIMVLYYFIIEEYNCHITYKIKIFLPFEIAVGVRRHFLSIYPSIQENILTSVYYIAKSANIALMDNRIGSVCQTKALQHLIVFY